jgi:hypothetical protein
VEKRVLTVLRSGGEYEPRHVRAMQRQIARWAPDAHFACLSDVDIPGVDCIPLKHDWPKWWAKVELFRPDIPGGYLYTDLDNVILGPIDELFDRPYTTQEHGWNALMYVPENFEHSFQIYEGFKANPYHWREKHFAAPPYVPFGDAGYVNEFVRGEEWEKVLPGHVINIVRLIVRWPHNHIGADNRFYPYKMPDPGVRVVLCANKNRRPWKLRMFKDLYEESV